MFSPDFYSSDSAAESDSEWDTDSEASTRDDSDSYEYEDLSSDPNDDDEVESVDDDSTSTTSSISSNDESNDEQWLEDLEGDGSFGGFERNRHNRMLPPSPTSWKFFRCGMRFLCFCSLVLL